jgi:hypothetical protein
MSELKLVIAHAVKLGVLAVIAGLLWRGKTRQCCVFPVYLVVILAGNTLTSVWPERFQNPSFWMLKQGLYDILKMAIALELAWRALAAFPGAMQTARRVFVVLLTATTLTLSLLTPTSSYRTLWEWQPRIVTASLWLFTATALLVVWYQIPVHDWQRAITLGFTCYLLVFGVALDMLKRHGWEIKPVAALIDALAYLGLILFWVWAVWRPEPEGARLAPARTA